MGPFCPEQGTSSHEIVMDLASTDEIVILLADEVGAVEMRDQDKNYKCEDTLYLPDESVVAFPVTRIWSLPYTPIRLTIQ